MPRYDWNEVQKFHDDYHTRAECARHFGLCAASWTNAKKRGALRQRPHSFRPEQIVAFRSRGQVRRAHLKAGTLKNICYECGISRWLGETLVLHLDYINGVANDHRFENLRCFARTATVKTETFAGRNVRRKVG